MEKQTKTRNFRKVEADVVRFDKVGIKIEGTLLSVEKGVLYDNDVYRLQTETGKVIVVFGTKILSSKMKDVRTGDYVKIVYTKDIPSKKKGLNDTKDFDVFVAE